MNRIVYMSIATLLSFSAAHAEQMRSPPNQTIKGALWCETGTVDQSSYSCTLSGTYSIDLGDPHVRSDNWRGVKNVWCKKGKAVRLHSNGALAECVTSNIAGPLQRRDGSFENCPPNSSVQFDSDGFLDSSC